MKIINTETASTMTKSLKLLTWSSSSPPISNRYPARHLSLQLLELWTRRFHDFRSESPVSRHRRHSDGPKLIARTHLFSLHSVFERRYLPALEDRTEGWIAGLQLSALTLQNRADRSELVKEFAGDNRFVLDYLLEEVLNCQTEQVQDFLLRTSILARHPHAVDRQERARAH